MLWQENNALYYRYDFETLVVEPWGANALRVRAYKTTGLPEENWALLPAEALSAKITVDMDKGIIENGKITARVTASGRIAFYNQDGKCLLEEHWRNRRTAMDPNRQGAIKEFASALDIDARELKPILGGDFALTARFESDPNEKIFGMGQYQLPYLNLKNCDLELAHRNSQASVPFALSNLGYGFLWNNPAIGRVSFGKNVTQWESYSSKWLDYWIVAGDSPAEIEEAYAKATGYAPMMPDYATGFWQCKLRYQTQEELLEVAREHKKRGLPMSVIVADYFHWPNQGDWKFDPDYWPDVEAMTAELKELGIELMVSIWPTVEASSENYQEMLEKGYLISHERGERIALRDATFFDATNPKSREFIWKAAKENYYDKGIKIFWLDEAEPELRPYDFDIYRYHLGPNLQVGNLYPLHYAQAFYEGMEAEGQENILNLLRCAWAGSQKYGALVWSGDIDSSFESMRNQFAAGLNMGIAGIPWWTTDIGGFHGGNPDDPAFRECVIRWFQWAAYCPVMRLHGFRDPIGKPLANTGGGKKYSGAANEVWSYGDEAYEIFKSYLFKREELRPYVTKLMEAAHKKGTPPMRPLFYDFPQDDAAWDADDVYMFGEDYLVAPVMYAGQRQRDVYLPKGAKWKEELTGNTYEGGAVVTAQAPLEAMPVFLKQ